MVTIKNSECHLWVIDAIVPAQLRVLATLVPQMNFLNTAKNEELTWLY